MTKSQSNITPKEFESKIAKGEPCQISDGDNLRLVISENGSAWWRFSYRINNKQKTISIGKYGQHPKLLLKDDWKDKKLTPKTARDIRTDLQAFVNSGSDPIELMKEVKQSNSKPNTSESAEETKFKHHAKDWWKYKKNNRKAKRPWSSSHAHAVWDNVSKNILPELGELDISKISKHEIISALEVIEARGSLEILQKSKQRINAIMEFARINDVIQVNPTNDIDKERFTSPDPKQFNSINPKSDTQLPKLIDDIYSFPMEETTRAGLKIALLTAQRTEQIRYSTLNELHLDKYEWHFEPERMKTKKFHVCVLNKQAIEVFEKQLKETEDKKYIFSSPVKSLNSPMSENCMLYALYRAEWRHLMTVHGMRHLFSTVTHSLGFDHHIIEHQLAHVEKNTTAKTYNNSDYLYLRKTMMAFWGDMIDFIREGNQMAHLRDFKEAWIEHDLIRQREQPKPKAVTDWFKT